MSTDSGARIDELIADPAGLQFVGEQDGPVERELRDWLIKVLQQYETVDCAYLARIQYSDEDTWAVVLCLRCSSYGKAEQTVRSAGDIFYKMFSKSQRLDIIVVDDERWSEPRAICTPFYVRTSGS